MIQSVERGLQLPRVAHSGPGAIRTQLDQYMQPQARCLKIFTKLLHLPCGIDKTEILKVRIF